MYRDKRLPEPEKGQPRRTSGGRQNGLSGFLGEFKPTVVSSDKSGCGYNPGGRVVLDDSARCRRFHHVDETFHVNLGLGGISHLCLHCYPHAKNLGKPGIGGESTVSKITGGDSVAFL